MTLPQLWNALYEGDIPEPGVKEFGSVEEARAWRREAIRRIAEAREKAEADARRRAVAAWRLSRRGY